MLLTKSFESFKIGNRSLSLSPKPHLGKRGISELESEDQP
jgi:hypothetical protein